MTQLSERQQRNILYLKIITTR